MCNAIKYKFYCAGPSKSKSTLSDEDDIDSEDDYDDEESGKEQKKKDFDISAPGTRVYLLFQIITFILYIYDRKNLSDFETTSK